MAPRPVTWDVLDFFEEDFDQQTGAFRHTVFATIDEDDIAYFGTLNRRKHDITLEQLTSALTPIPDHDFYPKWSPWNEKLTRAPDALPPNIYVKRSELALYGVFQEHNVLRLIPEGLFEEVKAMEMLSQHPHPNIIHYYGCRVRRGRITGLVLERHPCTLSAYLKNKAKSVDKEPFMEALESAIRHLHSLDWAHNDLNPSNVLVSEAGMPILIDFGSACRIGTKLGTSRGTMEWIDGGMQDYHTSDHRHDLSALEKIRIWLDKPCAFVLPSLDEDT